MAGHRFAVAVDNPHSNKSYYPNVQLLQHSGHDPELVATPELKKQVCGFILTQMTAKAGNKRFGDSARQAMREEFKQLDEKVVFEPMNPNDITADIRKQALRCVNLIKEKRCGKIKGRTCADGRPQRELYNKEQTSSPTAVSSDAIMLTLVVDALERRDVATADIAGAYLNADVDDFVLMKLEGEDVNLMCDVIPAYRKHARTGRSNKQVLYLRLAKALYGCVRSALLWYQLFSTTLQQMGRGSNLTLTTHAWLTRPSRTNNVPSFAWYVNDNKISHCDPNVVTDVIQRIERHFGKMSVTRGDSHDFLGMRIIFDKENGTAQITMMSYLYEAISESGMHIARGAATPATRSLFDVDQKAAPLDRSTSEMFRSVVCKLLYVGIRARTDLLTTLSYLTTRLTCPNTSDYRKLKRLLEYIHATIDLPLILGADDIHTMTTWVDASYAVHPDMQSHTGGVLSFGTGGLLCKSSRQKLNTKSSTEAELVGASDYLPNTIWTMNFMSAQGYPIKLSRFAQDNQSAMRLERNGRTSAGQKSRHINIRYFWITDRLRAESIRLEHCPTECMLGDFFTKPLQGSLFRKFRSVLLGHVSALALSPSSPPSPEERVEDQEQVGGARKWSNVVTEGRSPPISGV